MIKNFLFNNNLIRETHMQRVYLEEYVGISRENEVLIKIFPRKVLQF